MNVYHANQVIRAAEAEQRIARAEFRVFGQGIIDIVKPAMWKAQAKLLKIRQSNEIYILSKHTNETNVKIRHGLLDIKVKVGDTELGYEIFQPSGKYQFPINHSELEAILIKLKAQKGLSHDSFTLNAMLKVVKSCDDLVCVDVHKQRYGFSIDGVMCEYATILFNGAMVETACVESEDYQAMEKIIDKLEIGDFENINYLKAAKRVIGMM